MGLGSDAIEWFGEDEARKALVHRVYDDQLNQFQKDVYDLFDGLNSDGTMDLSEFSEPEQWQAHVTIGYGPEFAFESEDVDFDAARFAVARDDYQNVVEVEGKSRATKAYDVSAMWHKVNTLAEDWEDRYGDEANVMFAEELRTLKAMLNETQKAAYRLKQTPNWNVLTKMIEEWYEETQPDVWREAFVPLINGTMVDAGDEWAATLGITWDVRNLEGEAWFQDYMLQFADPITETSNGEVQALLAQAQAEGWTIPETEKRLDTLFQQWMEGDLTPEDFAWMEARMPLWRREAIARTETLRSANAGTLNLGKSWGIEKKFWIGTFDGRIRDSHIAARDTYTEQGAIPIDDDFNVGGSSMNAPHDPNAPAGEIVNCRCALGLLAA
jgi:hypothetical protein